MAFDELLACAASEADKQQCADAWIAAAALKTAVAEQHHSLLVRTRALEVLADRAGEDDEWNIESA